LHFLQTFNPIVQLENGHPTTLRNLNGPDQYDITRSDPVVPDNKFLIVIKIGLVLRMLENRPVINFLENVWEAGSNYLHEL
jgi:hypothetical protein